jgi:hypothetical protein
MNWELTKSPFHETIVTGELETHEHSKLDGLFHVLYRFRRNSALNEVNTKFHITFPPHENQA